MKALTCEMCGSTNLIKEGGVFVCQSCGTKYSVEEAKKMIVEGTVDVKGTVKVDTSDELINLYEIARRAKDSNNSENAAKYYEMILIKDPSSWEANFYAIYFKCVNRTLSQIYDSAENMVNNIDYIIKLVKENISNPEEQAKVINEVFDKTSSISNLLFNGAIKKQNSKSVDMYWSALKKDLRITKNIMYTLGDSLINHFNDVYGETAALSWQKSIAQHNTYMKYLQYHINIDYEAHIIYEYTEKIRKYIPSYQTPYIYTNKTGCYVATAVYGSYDCPEVWTLRRYRDYTLDETWYGRLFIKIYYTVSPTFVKYFGNVKMFKSQGKKLLDKWVEKLNRKGYENTPYKDKY